MAGLFVSRLAIDPGTSRTRIFRCGRGSTLDEPSLCAVTAGKKNAVFGDEALELLGRSPEGVRAVKPIREGIVSDMALTCAMLKHFIKAANPRRGAKRVHASVVTPSGSTELARQAIEDAVYAAGAHKVKLIEKPIAAALGAGISANECAGRMVVDIGAGLAEAAVISKGGIVAARSTRSAGDAMDAQIIKLLAIEKGLSIGERTAARLKAELGSAISTEERTVEVRGRDHGTGLPVSAVVSSLDICDAIKPAVFDIVSMVREVLALTPPELSADLLDNGIVLTGGGAALAGLAELMKAATGLYARAADDSALCSVLGAARLAGGKVNEERAEELLVLPAQAG